MPPHRMYDVIHRIFNLWLTTVHNSIYVCFVLKSEKSEFYWHKVSTNINFISYQQLLILATPQHGDF